MESAMRPGVVLVEEVKGPSRRCRTKKRTAAQFRVRMVFIIDRKALYVVRNVKQYGSMELVHSAEDVQNVMRRNGVKYVVIEQGMPLKFETAQKAFREPRPT